MRSAIAVVSVSVSILTGCSKGGSKEDTASSSGSAVATDPKQAPSASAIAIAYGDCATPANAFESGPRPLPFSLADLATKTAEAAATGSAGLGSSALGSAAAGSDTGTAMALDEGVMGKKDNDLSRGVEGQIKVAKADDPDAARKQAIEQARAAGIIGSTALQDGYGTGGLGLSGARAGGGADMGTIGLGRYGTIGGGTGTGAGYGIGAGYGGRGRRNPNVPTISIGQPVVDGDLDKAIIRRYIKRNINKIQYCYEKELLAKPSIAGVVTTQFFITPEGTVATAQGSGFDNNVASCVAGVIRSIEFPKPKGGHGVQVNYPFTFRPVDWSGTGNNDALPHQEAKTPVAAPDAPVAAPVVPVAPAPPPPEYKPGHDNPLAGQDAALRACVAKAATPYGAVVVDLAYEGGKVKSATATGTDAATSACIAAAAKAVAPAGNGLAQRCGFAFGEMPASALPAVDITADAIQLGGKDVVKLAALTAQTSTSFKIDALASALPAAGGDAGAALAMRTPFALRPVDSAPINVVTRVAETLNDGGADFYFTAKRGATWTPFRDHVTFPQVPTPVGTGQLWGAARKATRDLAAELVPDEMVHLSILVTKTSIWVGISRVNEFFEIKRDGADHGLGDLAKRLVEEKATAFFVDRNDLEIAGESAVTWGEVVGVIDAAVKAGFTNWMLAEPQALAAQPHL